jgi:peptidoglycan/LPS O-acetylase OafA/YrhL
VHRKDIDGLRAIAVLSVFAFHANLGVPGGFTGVDIFFVISGFLITSLIRDDVRQGRFSLLAFYERRMRRILPALFVVLAGSAVAAWILFLPPEFIMFGKSLALASVFSSNIGFWWHAGYFDGIAQFQPLLHTWSLSVEEQFYVVFPILLMVLMRGMATWRLFAIAALSTASFALSLYWSYAAPHAAFFLLPGRFWELGIGCLLALAGGSMVKTETQGALASSLGIGSIACGLVFISERSIFPGFSALMPVIGAALVIAGGAVLNPVSRCIGAPPLVAIGLVSYSLYLVHWPVIVFVQYANGRLLSKPEALGVLAICFAVSALLWAVVEQPFRRRLWLPRMPSLYGASAIVTGLAIIAGLTIAAAGGFPQRVPQTVLQIYAAKNDRTQFESCVLEAKSDFTKGKSTSIADLCGVGPVGKGQPSFLVWGDSHAAAIAPAIEASAEKRGQYGVLSVHGGCPPLLNYGIPSASSVRRTSCRAFNNSVMDMIVREKISVVFMVARWPRETLGVENGQEGAFYDPKAQLNGVDRSAEVARALDATLAKLKSTGVKPVLVMDVPEPGYDVPVALARAALNGSTIDVNPTRGAFNARTALERHVLMDASAKWDATIIDLASAFCDAVSCSVERKGIPLYVDADHLTRSAAEGLAYLFDPVLAAFVKTASRNRPNCDLCDRPDG